MYAQLHVLHNNHIYAAVCIIYIRSCMYYIYTQLDVLLHIIYAQLHVLHMHVLHTYAAACINTYIRSCLCYIYTQLHVLHVYTAACIT